MALGKYSPTVSFWYSKDQEWWKKNGGEFLYDKDGYDSYGYDCAGYDRAGHHEHDYMNDENLYHSVDFDFMGTPAPVVGDEPVVIQAYREEKEALVEAMNKLTERLASHKRDAHDKPNLKSVGQLINARTKIQEALAALNTI